ncbi:MAG: hypothetical protein UR66_C0005G0048 [Candidatus Moranbacteria bacterium GW2011_GWE1_35_17]|nr:MAG: hypothetical protein UR66_C0005G0048 [Candidatus Moranbacteria bacterium GW2011_GWE1_35_17]KKP72655.1 MAG: hypothetical protein UR65_C0013G0016 [Candidatus Moranbacteria bacterium GW2011_GWE2_35_164]KKP82688.1 MAG: hypothetical protein UR82_C0035G0004 [Candidatus Moranbacteria bacterium GW2011_GWF1_35_5]KKP83366.1 MAG: hypothetical protein UR83_C0036G0010 [Candidatus Moranbacteria bacterium GW2011_GWF2_35_54]
MRRQKNGSFISYPEDEIIPRDFCLVSKKPGRHSGDGLEKMYCAKWMLEFLEQKKLLKNLTNEHLLTLSVVLQFYNCKTTFYYEKFVFLLFKTQNHNLTPAGSAHHRAPGAGTD